MNKKMLVPGMSAGDLKRYHEELGTLIAQLDEDRSFVDRLSRHLRRHLPLYALGTVWALMIVLIPTVNDRDATVANAGTTQQADTGAAGGREGSATAGATGPDAVGQSAGSIAADARIAGGPEVPVAKVETGSGVTRGGFECRPGARQIPWSSYANECVAKFTGANGGKTYRGVDGESIRIAVRHPAVSSGDVDDAQDRAAGRADRAGGMGLLKKYASWFDKNMELYGRRLEFIDFESKVSNDIEEAQSRGKEGACADATEIAESVKAFAVVGFSPTLAETQPMAECAADRGLFVPFGASYFPEKFYAARHPYAWHIYMECEQIGHDVAEYMGKRLLNRQARWAKDSAYAKQRRVFGVYVPDNDGYQHCVDIYENDFKDKYGGTVKHRFNYQLDVSRFADQAEQAVVQFKAAGVTTLVNACDTISTRFLTDAAERQQWGPEWFIIGVATQDTDGQARTFRQSIVDGHLFGMSQLGQVRQIEGKDGEAYRTWKTAFPNEELPAGFGDAYFRVLALYVMLQAAGPVLTPANVARGLQSMPVGGGDRGPFGTWSFKGDHTAIDDSREIYWVGSAEGFDGSSGSYLEANGGKRFASGAWPAEEPPIYPKR